MENNEMQYVKMIYTMDYDTVNGKSKRPLLRAYEKLGITELIEEGNPFVLGYVYNNGDKSELRDFVTQRRIDSNGQSFQPISREEVKKIYDKMGVEKYKKLYGIMCTMFFEEKHDLGFEITTMDEMSRDRHIQWNAYQNGLTDINPYDSETLNDYTIKEVKRYNKH